eukprot:CAMPEP_0172771008 /NCGR_PEP_ID=MMETSP1074-20121228/189825_1 /TAXON_ID=2916 /ORGANISM="Ceratium fusus, Strain PA161109" /LENGTH=41 /DNA_ID= /DNA_START= /DNA_END= /DNA_ORIENTATION=
MFTEKGLSTAKVIAKGNWSGRVSLLRTATTIRTALLGAACD